MSPDDKLSGLYDLIQFSLELRDGEQDQAWSRVIEKLSAIFQAEAGTYYTYLPEKKHLFPKYSFGPHADDLKETPVDIRTGLCGWVATHREPLVVEDCYKDDRFLREVDDVTGFKTRSMLVLPLLDRHDLMGCLQLMNKAAGPFNDEDRRFAEAAIRVVMNALRSVKLETTVEKVSARNASILENLTGGFMAVDLHGRLIMCNPAAKRILGLPEPLKLPQPADQALQHVPRLADILVATVAARKTVKRQELQWSIKGEPRTLGYSTILIQDPRGELSGAGITFQDITRSA